MPKQNEFVQMEAPAMPPPVDPTPFLERLISEAVLLVFEAEGNLRRARMAERLARRQLAEELRSKLG